MRGDKLWEVKLVRKLMIDKSRFAMCVSADPSQNGFSVSSVKSYSLPSAGERRGTSSQRGIYGSLLVR